MLIIVEKMNKYRAVRPSSAADVKEPRRSASEISRKPTNLADNFREKGKLASKVALGHAGSAHGTPRSASNGCARYGLVSK